MSETTATKVALVTGGSRGIGAAIAKQLARDGFAVALTYSASPDAAQAVVGEIEARGGRALAIGADSADGNAVRAAVSRTVETFGRLDVLVNNAGVFAMGAVGEFSLDEFDRMLAVNVRAPFVAAQEASRHLESGGRIITIGSNIADFVGFPGASVYALTKAAVAGMTQGLARDLGPRGITVNNVQPGPTATDMNPSDGPFSALLRERVALGRYGEPDEIASFVSYLASPASAFITGANLTIDGGLTA